MLHDYHLYTAPRVIRRARPDIFLHHFIHIPWTQPDAWRVLPRDMREDIFEGLLSNDIVGFHTRAYRRNFLLCCRELFDLPVDEAAGVVEFEGRHVWVRAYPLPISADSFFRKAQREEVHAYEREILRRRRDHLILRVDRADLSKNVLRGFTAFDLFLEQHPEFRERVTFIAQLMPSRQDVPEYAEYLEKIEALVAVVNHRHGTTDWMPIDLRIEENLDQAIAYYKHYDLLIVNAMFDGMNLVAKEGPLVNERHGVSLLSENTGAHEELGEFSLSVNPFDVQEQADARRVWVASAMGPGDVEVSRAHGAARSTARWKTRPYRMRLVESDPIAYDQFYNVVANPMLWFIQHYLWDLSNAPDIRREEVEAYEHGYRAVNDDLASAVLEEVEDSDETPS